MTTRASATADSGCMPRQIPGIIESEAGGPLSFDDLRDVRVPLLMRCPRPVATRAPSCFVDGFARGIVQVVARPPRCRLLQGCTA